MSSLTPKQETFCREYIIDFNGKQAAIRAKYNEKTAEQQASRLLSNVKVQAYISGLAKVQADKLDISAERVLEELALIAFARPKKYMAWDNASLTLIASDDLTEADTAAIASVSYKETTTQFGGTTQVELKFHDKVKALSTILERYLDMDAAIALLAKRGYDAIPRPILSPQSPDSQANAGELRAGLTEAIAGEIRAKILGIESPSSFALSAEVDSRQESDQNL